MQAWLVMPMKTFCALLISCLLIAACKVDSPIGQFESVSELKSQGESTQGKEVAVNGLFVIYQHYMVISDEGDISPMLVIIPDSVRAHEDIERLISLGKDGWKGKRVSIPGKFIGRIVRLPEGKDREWAFELHSVQLR